MDKIFIEARYKGASDISADEIKKLPDKVAIFSSIQYLDSLKKLKHKIETEGKSCVLPKAKNATYPGQVLGCSINRLSQDVEAFIYVGDGMFHPKALAIRNEQPVFILKPGEAKLTRLGDEEATKYRKAEDIAKKKFYAADTIGIIVSTKPGQERIEDALALKGRLEKRCYILACDEVSREALENFPFIDCFVNTACPRLFFDLCEKSPVIDITHPIFSEED